MLRQWWSWDEGQGNRAREMSQIMLFLQSSVIFLNKCLSHCCRPLVNSRVKKRLIFFSIFCKCSLLLFMKERILKSLYFSIALNFESYIPSFS